MYYYTENTFRTVPILWIKAFKYTGIAIIIIMKSFEYFQNTFTCFLFSFKGNILYHSQMFAVPLLRHQSTEWKKKKGILVRMHHAVNAKRFVVTALLSESVEESMDTEEKEEREKKASTTPYRNKTSQLEMMLLLLLQTNYQYKI